MQCKGQFLAHGLGVPSAIRTHADVVGIAAHIQAGRTRAEIKDIICEKLTSFHHNEEEILENSVNLVLSHLLMICCGTFSYGFSGRTGLQWVIQGSSREHVADYFAVPPILGHENVKLEKNFLDKNFNAINLSRIAGLDIVWTDNLIDHLRMSDDGIKVRIFHHAGFLECQRESQKSLAPEDVAAEMLQILELLFQIADMETKKWFLKAAATARLDGRAIWCGRFSSDRRHIETFKVWRDLLVTLKQIFDEAQPRTLSQWWNDRRNGVQWNLFWVAALVLVLTVLFDFFQSVEGALQVDASFKSVSDPE